MPTIKEKADHVRTAIRQVATSKHTCHWPGCQKSVAPAAWGCRPHWYALPQALRNKIWASYVPKQEETKTPSRRYVEVAREVQQWIKENSK